MAWSTCNVFNPQISGAGADGDAIVTGLNFRVEDGDVGGHLDMDAVGVGAVSGGHDLHALRFYVLASLDHYVEHLTIHRGQPTNDYVFRATELQCLKINTAKEDQLINHFVYEEQLCYTILELISFTQHYYYNNNNFINVILRLYSPSLYVTIV